MAYRIALVAVGFLALGADATTSDISPRRFSVFVPAVGEGFHAEESVYEVYRSLEDFISRWPRDQSCDDSCARNIVATIDFTREMMLLIAPRGRGQDTYDVVVHELMEQDDGLDVNFIELRHGMPRDGLMCGVILTMPRPAIALLVPQSSKPVHFYRRRADVICEEPVLVN
jgi:hypothetical protein